MTREDTIIEMAQWWQSPPGRYLLDWEQTLLDHRVSDVFGFHALQLGLPQLEGLRTNRMPHRWVANDVLFEPEPLPLPPVDEALSTLMPGALRTALHCDFDALPFPDQSLDLVLLPHTLELARDPHDTLREVERVLVPEGRVIILGLNPASPWAVRQAAGHLRRRLGGRAPMFLPHGGEFIGFRRARDWLRLLGFEVEHGRFGCWRLPLADAGWLARSAWMDGAGARLWPLLGAVYAVEAVKRVRGLRLVGLAPQRHAKAVAAPAVVANRQRTALPAGPVSTTTTHGQPALLEQD